MKKKGFTLIEVVVSIGIFGILATVMTSVILNVVIESNRSLIKNEVRQNAERVMADIGAEIRKAGCVKYNVSVNLATLETYSDKSCTNIVATYISDAISPYTLKKNGINISAGSVAPLACSGLFVGCTCDVATTNGLVSDASVLGTTQSVKVSLTFQQLPTLTRSDFCAQVKLTDTFTPRN